jgi:hypothetical protein
MFSVSGGHYNLPGRQRLAERGIFKQGSTACPPEWSGPNGSPELKQWADALQYDLANVQQSIARLRVTH